jgi:predicted ribosome quality control (RQC) complex YloA/Tae2 family protein
MIQYHLDLLKQIKNIKEISLSQGQIQKIYSTAYYIAISVRIPGKTWYLYFGRGGGFEGVWIHPTPPPPELRRKDKFLDYLRRHLSSCSFLDVSLDPFDRIVRLDYQKFGKIQSFYWFWKGRKLYFIHYFQERAEAPFKILLSWRGKAFQEDSPDALLNLFFDEVGRIQEMKKDMSSKELKEMESLLSEELLASQFKTSKAKPDFLKRKKINIENDLKKASEWKKLQQIIDAHESLEGINELEFSGHRIKFPRDLNIFEKRDMVFQKIKKLKKGEIILKERLELVEKELSGKMENQKKISQIPIIKPVWGVEVVKIKKSIKTHEDYKIFSLNNVQIGIGLNVHGNDYLRNKWANRNDSWIHLDSRKSSHVIIKTNDNSTPSPEVLNLSASILAYFSQFNSDWIPIIHTQVKNLKGISGSPGMVTYKKVKRLNCPKQNLDEIIKD